MASSRPLLGRLVRSSTRLGWAGLALLAFGPSGAAAAEALERGDVVLGPLALCQAGTRGCDCVAVPVAPQRACWHGQGGRWGHGGCAAAAQCCDGAWQAKGACGGCACTGRADGDGCVAADAAAPSCAPTFDATIRRLSPAERVAMQPAVWRPGCPVSLDALRAIDMPIVTPEGTAARGTLVVASRDAGAVTDAFRRLYRHRFPITSMRPIEAFGGDDGASMAADNTSAFNCRAITGGRRWSEHAFGRAIDVNPLRNPYLRDTVVDPAGGRAWLDRGHLRPGMIVDPGPVVGAFRHIHWRWGGHWRRPVDLQHVSATGR